MVPMQPRLVISRYYPPLKLNQFPDEFAEKVIEVAQTTSPFTVTLGETTFFGPCNNILANRINDCDGGLKTLHCRLLARLGACGLTDFIPMEYVGDNYTPHSTITDDMIDLSHTIYVDDISYCYSARGIKRIKRLPLLNHTV